MKKDVIYNPIIIDRKRNGQFFSAVTNEVSTILYNKHGIDCQNGDVQYTICLTFLKAVFDELKKEGQAGEDVAINMSNYLEVGINGSDREDGEMEGNIVPYIRAGQIFKATVKNNAATEEKVD